MGLFRKKIKSSNQSQRLRTLTQIRQLRQWNEK